MNPATFPRPLLSLTLLACVLTLSACMDQACGLTSPSETVGSHGEAATDRIVTVHYYDELGSSDGVRISSGGDSVFVRDGEEAVFITSVAPGGRVTFTGTVTGGGSTTPGSATCSFDTAQIAGTRLTATRGNDDGRTATTLSMFCR
jgi:hypothetical protein